MMHRRVVAIVGLALCWGAPSPAVAAPAPAVAEMDPLKAAFDALPASDRRAVQDALVWTGDFNGAVAGTYGPRTHDALIAYARTVGVPPGAALDPATRASLLGAAAAARRSVGFAMVRDTQTGSAIGLPLTLLPLRTAIPDGSRYSASDGTIVVETTGKAAGPGALADAFARLTREAPGRRVTYMLSKPDVVVAAAETGDRKFYRRYAFGAPAGGGSALRGFTIAIPESGAKSGAKAGADLDRIVLAVAASFDPFPPVGDASTATSPPASPAPPRNAAWVGAAVLVGPGLALVRADAERCAAPEIDALPAVWLRRDPTSGLGLLALTNHGDARPAMLSAGAMAEVGAPRLVLFLVPGDAAPTLAAASATVDATGLILAPLQDDAGGVVIDGAGALAGLTGARDGKVVSVGGVMMTARYQFADAARLAVFLRSSLVPIATAEVSATPAGDAATEWRPLVLPLRCKSTPPASAGP